MKANSKIILTAYLRYDQLAQCAEIGPRAQTAAEFEAERKRLAGICAFLAERLDSGEDFGSVLLSESVDSAAQCAYRLHLPNPPVMLIQPSQSGYTLDVPDRWIWTDSPWFSPFVNLANRKLMERATTVMGLRIYKPGEWAGEYEFITVAVREVTRGKWRGSVEIMEPWASSDFAEHREPTLKRLRLWVRYLENLSPPMEFDMTPNVVPVLTRAEVPVPSGEESNHPKGKTWKAESRFGKGWDEEEDQILESARGRDNPLSYGQIAKRLGRTVGSVKGRAAFLGLTRSRRR